MKTRLNYIFYDPRNNYQNADGISVKKLPKKKKQLRDGMINRGKQIKSCNNRGHSKRKMRS